MKALFLPLSLALLLSMASCTDKKTVTETESRQDEQKDEIKEEYDKGNLTNSEAKRLEKRQENVSAEKREAAADDTITPEERSDLKRAQDKEDNAISRKTHNGRKR